MISIKAKYKILFADQKFRRSLLLGLALLFLAIIVNYFASLFALQRASSSVEDVILSNIPVFDVDWIFVWGPLIFWGFLAIFVFREPQRIPYVMKSIGVFIIIRCIFITLTHIGPFPDQTPINFYGAEWLETYFNINPYYLFVFSSGADLFFSAHTGLPFLMALVLWKYKLLRIFCLASSGFFGIVVLMGHLHYSIDVISAFFITYSIYHICEYLFKEERGNFYGYSQS